MADKTDFNDLASSEGLVAVQETVNNAVAAEQGKPFGAYLVKKDGVYWTPPTKNNADPEEIFFCTRLDPLGIARTTAGDNFALVLDMTDADNRQKIWTLPLESVQRAGGEEARAQFSNMGGFFGPGIRARSAFGDFLASVLRNARRNLRRLTLSDRCGWIILGEHRAFALPGETIGVLGKEEVIMTGTGCGTPEYTVSETVAAWRQQIGQYCTNNSRLTFSVAMSLAAPLLHPLGGEGGGFNFVGPSSIGKTTLFHLAASVAGTPNDFIKTCNATSNAFEAVAALHNDSVLLLDELGEASPEQIGGIVYKLAGGIGRGRADQHGNARERRQWRTIFATTGETDLATMMKAVGKRPFAGQELRLCDIPADAGQGLGVFEELHNFDTPAKFADYLRAATARVHGVALREFLQRLVKEMNQPSQRTERLQWLHDCRQVFISSAVPPAASGQVIRAAGRFSLVAAGGELGTLYGITGWKTGEATDAALTCFNDWLARRGTAGQSEVEQLLRQVSGFFEAHGTSRFASMEANARSRPIQNRAGFKRFVSVSATETKHCEYFVFPEAFRELVTGFDPRWASTVLVEKGLLRPGGDGKPQSVHRLPSWGAKRCYHFPPQPEDE